MECMTAPGGASASRPPAARKWQIQVFKGRYDRQSEPTHAACLHVPVAHLPDLASRLPCLVIGAFFLTFFLPFRPGCSKGACEGPRCGCGSTANALLDHTSLEAACYPFNSDVSNNFFHLSSDCQGTRNTARIQAGPNGTVANLYGWEACTPDNEFLPDSTYYLKVGVREWLGNAAVGVSGSGGGTNGGALICVPGGRTGNGGLMGIPLFSECTGS